MIIDLERFATSFRVQQVTMTVPQMIDPALKARLRNNSLHALDLLAERRPGWQTKVVAYRRDHFQQKLSIAQ